MLKETYILSADVDWLCEKGVGVLNEDQCSISGNLFSVFDGATSLTGQTFGEGRTGGYMAANIAATTFRDSNAPLAELAEQANRAIGQAMLDNGVDLEDRGGLWCTSAAAVRVGDDALEWMQIGDSLVCVIRDDDSFEVLCDNFNHDEETLCLWKSVSGDTDAPVAVAVKDKILEVRANMNRTYGVLNGEPQAMPFLRTGTLPLGGVSHVLLFTDGLFLPKEDPCAGPDFNRWARLFLRGGLSCVRDEVRRLERADADCRVYPRFKTHDDIAAIAISF